MEMEMEALVIIRIYVVVSFQDENHIDIHFSIDVMMNTGMGIH
jgi:hypothetical protein